MRILKPSKETAELFKDWLIYSPNVSRQSTGNSPPISESATTSPPSNPPQIDEEEDR